MRELPMFPLGTVLLPHMVLPLHVFEPRYRALLRTVMDDDREFGVVLIERGSEVGGGDQRSDLGTVARILEAEELEDGRWVAIAVGTSRLRVERWLEDRPYPRALVDVLDEPRPGPRAPTLLEPVRDELREVLSLQAALDEDPLAPPSTELALDPITGGYQAALLAPIGPYDRQRILAAASVEARLEVIHALLQETADVLRMRLQR